MKKQSTEPPVKRRNAEARAAWRLGHRVEKNPKAYSRKPKHKNPHRQDGGFSFMGAKEYHTTKIEL